MPLFIKLFTTCTQKHINPKPIFKTPSFAIWKSVLSKYSSIKQWAIMNLQIMRLCDHLVVQGPNNSTVIQHIYTVLTPLIYKSNQINFA